MIFGTKYYLLFFIFESLIAKSDVFEFNPIFYEEGGLSGKVGMYLDKKHIIKLSHIKNGNIIQPKTKVIKNLNK